MGQKPWLKALRKGDEVIVHCGDHGRAYPRHVDRVVCVTNSCVVVGPLTFDNKTGRKRGLLGTHIPFLCEPTPDDVARVKLDCAREGLPRVDWHKVDPSVVERICAILDEQPGPGK